MSVEQYILKAETDRHVHAVTDATHAGLPEHMLRAYESAVFQERYVRWRNRRMFGWFRWRVHLLRFAVWNDRRRAEGGRAQ